MALRDQPYFPLYVQDFLTDEKLMECSAEATGVCIKTMCVMHKSNEYGKICLKPKDKKSEDALTNFASKLSKHFPWDVATIKQGLTELVDENVMQINSDCLVQKRMVEDNIESLKKSKSGKKGANARYAKKKPIPPE
ncbi:hypothetical protein [Maribellus mangrovi]|uniref:hypothetical protein n=1 Tax=Maribellus mangrovi TaxID=3133146 RepID=UPI0030EB6E29